MNETTYVSGTEIKNVWTHLLNSSYVFMAWCSTEIKTALQSSVLHGNEASVSHFKGRTYSYVQSVYEERSEDVRNVWT